MKIPRKLKKKIINCFGRGTYYRIIEECLYIEKYNKGHGCITKVKGYGKFYYSHQYNPYVTFPNLY